MILKKNFVYLFIKGGTIMGFWEQFPYTNFHEMNLNWLIKKMKNLEDRVNDIKTTEPVKKVNAFLNGKKILCVGDSTAAEPNSAVRFLKDFLPDATITNVAKSGASITPLYNNNVIDQLTPDNVANSEVIIITAGINDWQNSVEIDSLKTHVTNVLLRIFDYSPTPLVIWCTPFSSYRNFGAHKEPTVNYRNLKIKDYCRAISDVCEDFGCMVVDLYKISGCNQRNYRALLDESNSTGIFVHPNKFFAQRMAAQLAYISVSNYQTSDESYIYNTLPSAAFISNATLEDINPIPNEYKCEPFIKSDGTNYITSRCNIVITGKSILTGYCTGSFTLNMDGQVTTVESGKIRIPINFIYNKPISIKFNGVLSGLKILAESEFNNNANAYGIIQNIQGFSEGGVILREHGAQFMRTYITLPSPVNKNGKIGQLPFKARDGFFIAVLVPKTGNPSALPCNITDNGEILTMLPLNSGDMVILPSIFFTITSGNYNLKF